MSKYFDNLVRRKADLFLCSVRHGPKFTSTHNDNYHRWETGFIHRVFYTSSQIQAGSKQLDDLIYEKLIRFQVGWQESQSSTTLGSPSKLNHVETHGFKVDLLSNCSKFQSYCNDHHHHHHPIVLTDHRQREVYREVFRTENLNKCRSPFLQ